MLHLFPKTGLSTKASLISIWKKKDNTSDPRPDHHLFDKMSEADKISSHSAILCDTEVDQAMVKATSARQNVRVWVQGIRDGIQKNETLKWDPDASCSGLK